MKLIVAVDQNWGIGKDNKLPWHNKEDLAWFKMITLNQKIVMGRSTFESLPGVLPNRHHIVLSRGTNTPRESVDFVSGVEELVSKYGADLFVIGGRSVYEQLFKFCDELFVTFMYDAYDCDTYFPSNLFVLDDWSVVKSFPIFNGCIVHYERNK